MNHKRGRPKNRRAGCLFCKPHKANGAKNRVLPRDARRTEPTRSTDNDAFDPWDDYYDDDWDSVLDYAPPPVTFMLLECVR